MKEFTHFFVNVAFGLFFSKQVSKQCAMSLICPTINLLHAFFVLSFNFVTECHNKDKPTF